MPSPSKPAAPLSRAEFSALGTIARARRDNLQAMFAGSKIVYGHPSKAVAAASLAKAGKNIHSNVQKLRNGTGGAAQSSGGLRGQAAAMIREAVGVDMPDLVSVITNQVVEDLIREMVPYLGIFTSASKAQAAWSAVLTEARKSLNWDAYTAVVLPGDPMAACDAVHDILKRNMARDTTTATIQTAAVAAKIAGMAGDMGTGASTAIIGLATGLASLAVELTQLGIDIKEMRAGNKQLAYPEHLDKEIFKACPLVGSYLMAYSPPSMVLGFFVAEIGLPGWMDKIETFKKQGLDPIVETANAQIARSRITVSGFNTGKGFVPDKSIGDRLAGLKWKNVKFQFNRLVRSQLPF
jgi:hypothetical protein